MKQILVLLQLLMLGLVLVSGGAEAKRFGGGGSVGHQRSVAPQPAKPPVAAPSSAAGTPSAPTSSKSKWLGPLAGLAVGAGLAALFMGGGMGSLGGILLIMMAVGLAIYLFTLLRKKPDPIGMPLITAPYKVDIPQIQSSIKHDIPSDFPADAFLRSAQASFIFLQKANDRKDLNAIREYTTPEMFAEIYTQVQNRGDAPQKIELFGVQGELIGVQTETDRVIASVRFTGHLSENDGAPEAIDEIWHVQKSLVDSKPVWLLAGIQQTVAS